MKDILITKSFTQTKKIAANLAREIFPPKAPRPPLQAKRSGGDQPRAEKLKPKRKATVIGLIGDLGSGKTVFAQGFAKGLGIKENIISPTFVLERIYELPIVQGRSLHRHFVHIDAYRIEKPKELIDLGFKELIRNPKNIILIEWADRVRNILPKGCIRIEFEHMDKNKRKIWIRRRIN